MNRFPLALVAVSFVLWLPACGLPWWEGEDCSRVLCGPCAPALTLRVSGAPGRPAPDVVMGGGQGECAKNTSFAVCSSAQNGAGRYEVELQAPGYRPVHVVEQVNAVERTGCCSCGYEPRTVDVQLVLE
ncbi:hypothetical protein JRI60_31875 [Archangium violaceum]|uniref:hypothetical protein n=1 Tax=Archangium violaceum TaxID=83451 RepID=UPI00194E6419|nr:hypothetical protein [Archangium violaceum]QRN93754.1 hypothetical protein JRI60_31875 [Archangium violaceum]